MEYTFYLQYYFFIINIFLNNFSVYIFFLDLLVVKAYIYYYYLLFNTHIIEYQYIMCDR